MRVGREMGRETLKDVGPLHQLSINFGLDDHILIWYQTMLSYSVNFAHPPS